MELFYRKPENRCQDHLELGIDEAGKGPLFGPIYVAGVVLNPDIPLPNKLNDSKKLSRKYRAQLREWIEKNAMYYYVTSRDARTIDRINIVRADIDCMNEVITKINSWMKRDNRVLDLVTIDGIQCPQRFDVSIMPIIRGDCKYANIASASILAKEYHDDWIKNYVTLFPDLDMKYGLLSNMGYGTYRHIRGIKDYGLVEMHRKSFKLKSLES